MTSPYIPTCPVKCFTKNPHPALPIQFCNTMASIDLGFPWTTCCGGTVACREAYHQLVQLYCKKAWFLNGILLGVFQALCRKNYCPAEVEMSVVTDAFTSCYVSVFHPWNFCLQSVSQPLKQKPGKTFQEELFLLLTCWGFFLSGY